MSQKACVIGWPIRHSRSPLIHGYWLRQHGIAGSYEKVAVEPETLDQFVRSIAAGEYLGCNVTVPHKEAVMGLLDEVDETARAIGAVNTIWRDAGRLKGTNTDVIGFMANLDDRAPGWDAGNVNTLILGAGGAARAVIHGLQTRGVSKIRLANRTPQRAQQLAREFGNPVEAVAWREIDRLLPETNLLINTTSLGMAGSEPLPDCRGICGRLPKTAVVSDIVYVPLQTELLVEARKAGLRTVDGLGMLLHQAVPGFEKWFGVRPTVTPELRRLIEADIEAPSHA
ncbi:shikimate dehydrogenase [Flaviflagellibacter deserti]|uniref:Shikimate dehydrogenase (NADP(+)) n=1 Tax=Flaviflagellibacter deserti TaxID=2267266 RepID=A0ABV9Z4T8_9HYPH